MRRRDWDAADALVAELRALPAAPTAYYALMAERIAGHRTAPPPPDWNGVHVAASK